MKVFLTADWKHLFNLTFKVKPEQLMHHLPSGLELDVVDGSAFVSLVAFDFVNTKVKGFRIPFHVDFPEINLRYYVNYKGRRGVVFIREYVPKHCIAYVANKLYNEPYASFPMESKVEEDEASGIMSIKHQIWVEEKEFSIGVEAEMNSSTPGPESVEHFFKEHDVGFGVDHSGQTLYYLVDHPIWEAHKVLNYQLDLDFGKMYGEEWAFLGTAEPHNAMVAKGSYVKVFSPRKLQDMEIAEEIQQES
ncbi:MAG: DUF2071 domain-containing protein [Bacteroidia bacterium]|nr:DUF2071 domain-containing protein [Bacteroidia bacterium]